MHDVAELLVLTVIWKQHALPEFLYGSVIMLSLEPSEGRPRSRIRVEAQAMTELSRC